MSEDPRLAELTEYARREVEQRRAAGLVPPGATEVHVHYHQAPVTSGPVDQNPDTDVLAKYTPYFIVGLYGVIICGAVVGLGVLLVPVIMGILGSLVALVLSVAAATGAVAVLMLGGSAAIRNMRETPKTGRRRK